MSEKPLRKKLHIKIILDNICLKIELGNYEKEKIKGEKENDANFVWYLYKDDSDDLLMDLLFFGKYTKLYS